MGCSLSSRCRRRGAPHSRSLSMSYVHHLSSPNKEKESAPSRVRGRSQSFFGSKSSPSLGSLHRQRSKSFLGNAVRSTIQSVTGSGNNNRNPSMTPAEFSKSLIEHQRAEDEYAYLATITHFDEETLRLLHVRFNAIDSTIERDSRVSLDEFAAIIQMPPKSILVSRFFKYMDAHNVGLTFRIFATTMSILSEKASMLEKTKLSFSLCDLNDDGYLDHDELVEIIQDCLRLPGFEALQLDDEHIDRIVQNTFAQLGVSETDRISFAEYCEYIQTNKEVAQRIMAPYSLDISKLIHYEAESRRLRRYANNSLTEKSTQGLHHGPLSLPAPSMGRKVRNLLPAIGTDRVTSIHDPRNICVDPDDFQFSEEEETTQDSSGHNKSKSVITTASMAEIYDMLN